MSVYNSGLMGCNVHHKEGTILFYGGIFSQWVECEYFINIGDVKEKVNCAEQAMMLYKAHVFDDSETYFQILDTTNPSEQKMLGRKVQGFDNEKWKTVAYDFVARSTYEKFNQNKVWKELLMLTWPYELVEASPTDKIWGIGYSAQNPSVFKERKDWGSNLLGIALMKTRADFLK